MCDGLPLRRQLRHVQGFPDWEHPAHDRFFILYLRDIHQINRLYSGSYPYTDGGEFALMCGVSQ